MIIKCIRLLQNFIYKEKLRASKADGKHRYFQAAHYYMKFKISKAPNTMYVETIGGYGILQPLSIAMNNDCNVLKSIHQYILIKIPNICSEQLRAN